MQLIEMKDYEIDKEEYDKKVNTEHETTKHEKEAPQILGLTSKNNSSTNKLHEAEEKKTPLKGKDDD